MAMWINHTSQQQRAKTNKGKCVRPYTLNADFKIEEEEEKNIHTLLHIH